MTTIKRLNIKVKRSDNGKWSVNGEEYAGNKGTCVMQWLKDHATWSKGKWEMPNGQNS